MADDGTRVRPRGGSHGGAATGMATTASTDSPLAIDRVDRARGEKSGVSLRLTGRWLRPVDAAQRAPLLVVEVQGRRHRFAPHGGAHAGESAAGQWAATFNLPSWAEPRRDGQAALWVGTSIVPVPLPGGVSVGAIPLPGSPPLTESVSALQAELEERSREVARLQGSLADVESELEARTALQAALESAQSDLRRELQELMSAVSAQRQEHEQKLAAAELRHRQDAAELSVLRDQLAAADVSRDAALGEVAGLRVELERLGSELAVTREYDAAKGGDLGEAQRLLAEARSLSEQLRSQSSQ
ncbi:MAG: hypothetical protein ACJ780_18915 [Solirubrobacteraceae bacterium]